MKKCLKALTKKRLFLLGLVMVMLAQLPLLIMGQDVIVTYHDQLDGEIIAYIYRAKYLFSGQNHIPEFLNGAMKTTLTPPAPLAVLLFRVLPPLGAYGVMQLVGQLVAYVGMFLLADLLTENKYIGFVVALLYTFLPFLPVYGLSQYGVPMLLVSLYYLWQKKYRQVSLLYVAFYVSMSSLVLCGFVWLILLGTGLLLLAVRRQLKAHFEITAAFLILVGIYVLTNLSLLGQILGVGEGFVSHKTEYALGGGRFWDYFWTYLWYNGDHSTDYHQWILVLAGIILVGAGVRRFWGTGRSGVSKSDAPEAQSRNVPTARLLLLSVDLACIVVLCMAAALWNCNLSLGVREGLGTLGAFQLVRILWIAPALWYAALALCLVILWDWKARIRRMEYMGYLAGLGVLSLVGLQCLKGSTLKMCLQELLLPGYETISWSDYLALGVMDQVEEYLLEQEGLAIEEYKVASIGIDPSAALYHGFYCVDGYSNNYDLAYKHAFRKVIATELDKNEWLKSYYDDWGNRCYLFSAEIPGYFNIEKGTSWYNFLELDTKALKELGCDYILSAAYIVNAEDNDLVLLREEAFETPESYYRIYLYRIDW